MKLLRDNFTAVKKPKRRLAMPSAQPALKRKDDETIADVRLNRWEGQSNGRSPSNKPLRNRWSSVDQGLNIVHDLLQKNNVAMNELVSIRAELVQIRMTVYPCVNCSHLIRL